MSFFPILAVQGKTVKAKISVSCSKAANRLEDLESCYLVSFSYFRWHFVKYEKPYLLSQLYTKLPAFYNRPLLTRFAHENCIHRKDIVEICSMSSRIFQHSLRSQSLSFQFTSVFWDHRSGKAPGIFVSGLCGIFGHYRKVFLRFTDECFGGSQYRLQVRFYFTVNSRFLRTANLWTVLWIFSWNFCRQFVSWIWKRISDILTCFCPV